MQRWVPRISRTTDQMVQAARSGKQNIVEGGLAAAISKEMEIKLTGVAYASLGELLEDYRENLDVRDADEWTPDHPYARRLSNLCRTPGANDETFRQGIKHPSANVLAGLCRVTMHLLEGQMERLERDFVQEGGLRERMRQARLEFRKQVEEKERQRAREREGRRDGRRDERDGRDKRD